MANSYCPPCFQTSHIILSSYIWAVYTMHKSVGVLHPPKDHPRTFKSSSSHGFFAVAENSACKHWCSVILRCSQVCWNALTRAINSKYIFWIFIVATEILDLQCAGAVWELKELEYREALRCISDGTCVYCLFHQCPGLAESSPGQDKEAAVWVCGGWGFGQPGKDVGAVSCSGWCLTTQPWHQRQANLLWT